MPEDHLYAPALRVVASSLRESPEGIPSIAAQLGTTHSKLQRLIENGEPDPDLERSILALVPGASTPHEDWRRDEWIVGEGGPEHVRSLRLRCFALSLGELPVERFGARSDLVRDRLPRALCRKTFAVPGGPGVAPFAIRSERKDLRAEADCVKLAGKVNRPRFGEPGILREKPTHRGLRDSKGLGWTHRNAVAEIAHGEYGGFGEERVRERPLENQRDALCAVSNEVRLPDLDNMQHGHLVAKYGEERRSPIMFVFARRNNREDLLKGTVD